MTNAAFKSEVFSRGGQIFRHLVSSSLNHGIDQSCVCISASLSYSGVNILLFAPFKLPLSRVVCRIFCCYSACQRSVDPTAARHHPCSFLQSDFLSPINVLLFSPAAVTESPALFPVVKARCLVTAKGGVFIAEGAFCSRPRGSFPPP